MADWIAVRGIAARGFHGVFAQEKRDGQRFVADVAYRLDTRPAARGDDLAASVSYADVAATVHAELTGPSRDLIETLAEDVARAVLGYRGVAEARVTVHKPEAPVGVPFDDVALTIRRTPLSVTPARPREVVFGLGANLGQDPAGQLAAALAALRAALGDLEVGPLAVTAPVLAPGQAPQPDYYNTVAIARTALAADELLALAHRVEAGAGRERHERWGARTLDVDIIDVQGLASAEPHLTIPHPRAARRAFVLAPYARLRPGATLGGVPVPELLDAAAGDIRSMRESWL